MALLKPAKHQTAYLKLGLQGFEGSGKTYLACQFAMGISELMQNKKVAYFDTEKGSDFWVSKFQEKGIQLDTLRSRSFVDLLNVIREAEANKYEFLIIDSITHVWRDLGRAYQKKKNRDSLSMKDWMVLKTEWSQFTDLYVNSKVHIAMCGRAGYEYDFEENEDGKKEITKSGTKMKAEGETGFEPDLLIETFKVSRAELLTDKKAKKNSKGFINRCCVIKDRSDLMNAKIIDQPKFEHFLPIVKFLNLGGSHAGPSAVQGSESLFQAPERSYAEQLKRKEIALEEIKEALVLAELDGSSAETKKKRIELLVKIFGTSSWTAISDMRLDPLQGCLDQMRIELNQKKAPEGSPIIMQLSAEEDVPL